VRNAVLAELPGGEAGALVARTGLVDPDMDRDAVIVGAINRGERGAPVDGGEPPGIAMRHNLDRPKPPLCSKATAINSVPRAMAVLAVFCSQITASRRREEVRGGSKITPSPRPSLLMLL
jgi:hypothetical protein